MKLRPHILFLCVFLKFAGPLLIAAENADSTKPNIVFILADDLG